MALEVAISRGAALGLVVSATTLLSPRAAHALEPPLYQLELGPNLAYVQRHLEEKNQGVGVKSALVPGMVGRAYLFRWLAVGIRYNRALHGLDLSSEALGLKNSDPQPAKEMQVTTLQGSVYGVWPLLPTLQLFAGVGLGWGSVIAPAIGLSGSPTQSEPVTDPTQQKALSSLRQRRGVVIEAPLGVGLTWWVLRNWISISYEASYAPAFGSSGDVYSTEIYVNKEGLNATATAMPRFVGSAYHHLGLTLTL